MDVPGGRGKKARTPSVRLSGESQIIPPAVPERQVRYAQNVYDIEINLGFLQPDNSVVEPVGVAENAYK